MARLSTRHMGPFGAFALIVAAYLTAACDTVPLAAPSNSSITVTASSTVLATGGTAEVSAAVMESGGTPVQNGTMVRFTTNLGRVDPVEAQTRNGVATTTFHAGDASGTAEVRATSGGAGGGTGTTPSNKVDIKVGAAAVKTVTLRANPGSVPSSGGTVELIASVTDEFGRALASVPVNFTATAGSLASVRVITDAAGEARTQLTTTQESDVKASAGVGTDGAVKVTVQAPPGVQTVTLGAASEAAVMGVGQRWNFTATITGTGTNPSPAVQFDWDFGDGATATTNGNTTSHVYTTPNVRRIATVRVTLANGQNISATVEFIVGPF